MTAGVLTRRGARRCLCFSLTFLAFLPSLIPQFVFGQQDERSVRAAFVYNLTKYVTWPDAGTEMDICVLGGGPTGPALKLVVDGKTSQGQVLHVLLDPSEAALRRCSILYWSGTSLTGIRSILDKSRGRPVLTVGEDDRFVREGGMIGFVRSGDSVQIEVNLESIEAGGLKVSSRLLKLATLVHGEHRS